MAIEMLSLKSALNALENPTMSQFPVLTNVYKLNSSQVFTIFKYKVDIWLSSSREKVHLTKRSANDSIRVDRVEAARCVLRTYLQMNRLVSREDVCYNGSSSLYCTKDFTKNIKPSNKLIGRDVPEECCILLTTRDKVSVTIDIAPEVAFRSDSKDEADLITIKHFFDALTSSDAHDNPLCIVLGSTLFDTECGRSLGYGFESKLGTARSTKFIKGPSNDGCEPSVSVDTKCSVFYSKQSVFAAVVQFMKDRWKLSDEMPDFLQSYCKDVEEYLTGVRVRLINSSPCESFIIDGITNVPLRKLIDSIRESYMHQENRYESCLGYPAVRRKIEVRRQSKVLFYPLELLEICENQRVPLSIIEKTSGLPDLLDVNARFLRNSQNLESLNLHDGGDHNEYLKRFNMTLSKEPLTVNAFKRPKPEICYDSEKVLPSEDRAEWSIGRNKYMVPARCSFLLILYTCSDNVASLFSKYVTSTLRERGVTINEPILEQLEDSSFDTLKRIFRNVVRTLSEEAERPMVILINDKKKDKDSHRYLKLLEREFFIITQHFTIDVVKQLRLGSDMLSNVANKINSKLGGLNYSLVPEERARIMWVRNSKVMVVGYDVSHPTNIKTSGNPSVVGFSFNGSETPEAFIGDFHYQTALKEQVEDQVLNRRFKWMISSFHRNRGFLPESILILRDGVSSGQYDMVKTLELDAIKEALEEYKVSKQCQDWRYKIVLCIVTKRHNTRFAKKSNDGSGKVENLEPGTVIDEVVVSASVPEYYLHSHNVVSGSGKTPSYQTLVNEASLSRDELQAFNNSLCYLHQICESPISLPEAVYQADEWAKRGFQLFTAYLEQNERDSDNYPVDRMKNAKKDIDFNGLSEKLGYWRTPLANLRVNA